MKEGYRAMWRFTQFSSFHGLSIATARISITRCLISYGAIFSVFLMISSALSATTIENEIMLEISTPVISVDEYDERVPTEDFHDQSISPPPDTIGFLIDDGGLSSQALVSETSLNFSLGETEVSNGKNYLWKRGVNHGDTLYNDRDYTIAIFPTELSDYYFLETSNDDKNMSDSQFLNFTVNQDVTVYLAYETRATSLPTWLSSWEATGALFGANEGSHFLYKKDFSSGTITLGGNMSDGAAGAGSNYSVLVAPQKNILPTPDPSPSIEPLPEVDPIMFPDLTIDDIGSSPEPLPFIIETNVLSGKSYIWHSGFNMNDPLYIDRTYEILNAPSELSRFYFLQTANNDKNYSALNFLTFEITQDATVYVAYDVQATDLPDWLSDWDSTEHLFGANTGSHKLYAKDFSAGSVQLGGNMAAGSNGASSNYLVLVGPQPGPLPIPDPEPTPAPEPTPDPEPAPAPEPIPEPEPTPDPPNPLDKMGVQWNTLEWSLKNNTFSGNPFDLVASVTFTHQESGETVTTEMYFDQNSTWRFRFAATKAGTWSFTTSSADIDLDGKAASITVEPNNEGIGFLTSYGNKFARQTGVDGSQKGLILNVYQNPNKYPDLISDFRKNPSLLHAYLDDVKAHGMNSITLVVNNSWFKLGANSYFDHFSTNPDTKTFELLEWIITTAHNQGVNVHFWAWGDEERRWTSIGVGGINGIPDKRLQRYIAARLGPLPGWTMGYGFDLQEWTTENQLAEWASYLEDHSGWDHLLMGRGRSNQELDVISYSGTGPNSYQDIVDNLASDPNRPHFYEERFFYQRWGKYDMETTRRQLWWNAMAGGVGAWWGIGFDQPSSFDYPNIAQLKTYGDFWQDRFRIDWVQDNQITDGYALRNQTNNAFIFYKEDTSSIQMNLLNMTSNQNAIAVDTKGNYVELDLGVILPDRRTWKAPYTSDWAIAVGNLQSGTASFMLSLQLLPSITEIPPPVMLKAEIITLDGINKFVELSQTEIFMLDQGTLALRFKAADVNRRQGLWSKNSAEDDSTNNLSLIIEDSKVKIQYGNSNKGMTISSSSVKKDTWYNLVMTFGDAGMKIYIDGLLNGMSSYTTSISNNDQLVVGAITGNSSDLLILPLDFFFLGQIAQIQLYNEQLSSFQLNEIFKSE